MSNKTQCCGRGRACDRPATPVHDVRKTVLVEKSCEVPTLMSVNVVAGGSCVWLTLDTQFAKYDSATVKHVPKNPMSKNVPKKPASKHVPKKTFLAAFPLAGGSILLERGCEGEEMPLTNPDAIAYATTPCVLDSLLATHDVIEAASEKKSGVVLVTKNSDAEAIAKAAIRLHAHTSKESAKNSSAREQM